MILSADYPPRVWSGIGVAVAHQARALASAGIEVHVMLAERVAHGIARADGPVHLHSLNRPAFPVDARLFDIIHLHSLALSELAVQLKRRFHLPLVYTAHSLLPLELAQNPARGVWSSVQGRMFALSDRVIFVSEPEYGVATAWVPALRARASWLPNGLPPPPPLCTEIPAGGPVVFAGRFTHSKGIQTFVRMIPWLRARYPARFVFAGGHGDAEGTRRVLQVAERYGDICQVMGWLNKAQLEALLASAALVVVPSRYEPFGLVALEALRMGAPVLASTAGNLPAIVHRESGGRIVDSYDPVHWAAVAYDMISDPRLRLAAREKGPRYVADHYDITRITVRLIREVYSACSTEKLRVA